MRTQWPTRAAVLAAGTLLALGAAGSLPGAAGARVMGPGQETEYPTIRVSHDRYPAHAEPTLAVDPRDPHLLLGAAMLIRGHHVVVGTFSSVDGGQTWYDHGPLSQPPGTTYSGDVTVAFDARGVGFVASAVQAVDGGGVYVWRTNDGGYHFGRPVAVAQGQADHPGLAVDALPGSGTGDLYVAWSTHRGLAFSRSVDGGRHFTAPWIIAPGETWLPVTAAGLGGAVYVAYEATTQGTNGRAVVITSPDRGQHFGRPTVAGPMDDTLTSTPGVRLPTGPSVATDPRDGAVYVAYADAHAGGADVLLARSETGGRTWSAPLRVTAASHPDGTVPFQPHVVVDDARGVDITYFALAHGRVSVVLSRSATYGAGFGSGQQITTRPFDPTLGVISPGKGDQGSFWWIGDYQGLAAGGGLIHPFWNDTRTGRLEIFTSSIPAPATVSVPAAAAG